MQYASNKKVERESRCLCTTSDREKARAILEARLSAQYMNTLAIWVNYQVEPPGNYPACSSSRQC